MTSPGSRRVLSRGRVKASTSRRSGVRVEHDQDLPNAYRELLVDTLSSSQNFVGSEGKTVKKRRVGGRVVTQDVDDGQKSSNKGSEEAPIDSPRVDSRQTAYNDSSDSSESDEDFEDVDLEAKADFSDTIPRGPALRESGYLTLVLGKHDSLKETSSRKRKPLTASERRARLNIHKLNILCLMSHAHLRNHWCNDSVIQAALKGILSKKTISYLRDDETQSQFQRKRSLVEGLEQAIESFGDAFTVSARGMERAYWAGDNEDMTRQARIPDDIDLPTQKSDFRSYGRKLSASRDIGAQLFCAMLRSIGVDTRLVCSLQALPFTAAAQGNTAVKQWSMMAVTYPETETPISGADPDAGSGSDASINSAKSSDADHEIKQIRSKLKRRFGGSPAVTKQLSTPLMYANRSKTKKRLRESQFPVYWVEAFDAAYQKWICVDPLVTKRTIDKPTKLAPPANDIQNGLTYAIAFEDDGSARDVTRRYAKAYNAKTRKLRVESTKEGEIWWRKVMRLYKRPVKLIRDQLEDTELAAREAAEEMPRNVQDFKDHPYYALERHLRRHEVLHPRREIGRVSTGKGTNEVEKGLEPIFRRRDVHIVKSANSWYRLGREIKKGEQPLKWVQRGKKRSTLGDEEEHGDEESAGNAMYAGFQTCLYQAPPVVSGRVPKNEYGNIDVYVSTMVPPGAAHISHADSARAARLLGIDYADAVTGFQFKGRQGTAVVNGVVIAQQFQDAVEAIIQGLEDEKLEADHVRRSVNALRFWKRFFAGLKIRERIDGYKIEGDKALRDEEKDYRNHVDEMNKVDQMSDEAQDYGGGGFLPNQDAGNSAEPNVDRFEHSLITDERRIREENEAGDLVKESGESSTNPVNTSEGRDEQTVPNYLSGGLLVVESTDAGGFLLENAELSSAQTHCPSFIKNQDGSTRQDESLAKFPNEMHAEAVDLIGSNNKSVNANLKGERGDRGNPETGLAVAHDSSHGLGEEELDEAHLIQQLYESERKCLRQVSESAQAQSVIREVNIRGSSPPVSTHQASPKAEQQSGGTSTESDKGSLLSHDPDDEDADPDWLA